jgi:hypothetical protein
MSDIVRAALLGLLGMTVFVPSLLVDPPFTSTFTKPVEGIDSACCGSSDYQLVVCNDYCMSFILRGPIRPDFPVVNSGDVVSVTYQDLARGRIVLFFTKAPGTSTSVTYTTLDYDQYRRNLAFSWLALAGIAAGALVMGAAVLLFRIAGRRREFASGATSAAIAPLTLLGGLFYLPLTLQAYYITPLIGVVAAIAAPVIGLNSLAAGERPRVYAKFGIWTAVTVSAVWLGSFLIVLAKNVLYGP